MKSFKVEIKSSFPEWDRYSVYMTAVCFGADGAIVGYINLSDKGGALETVPCDHADLYLYVIADRFPASDIVAQSPPFEVELSVCENGGKPHVATYRVNQWGGLSVKKSLA
ncbi:MAG: hypothetical protein LBV18_07570 [Alistipes sp.]|jgi:hypothetical protein|nr:hypothetical protein [Alistipes sp.]